MKGRPPKSRAAKQSARVMLAFTPREIRDVRRVARDVPVSTFIRALVLRVLEAAAEGTVSARPKPRARKTRPEASA